MARLTQGPSVTMHMAERAKALSSEVSRATQLQIDAAWGAGAVMCSHPEGFDVLTAAAEAIQAEPEMLKEFSDSGWWPILWCMLAATFTERFDEAQRAYDLGFPAAEQMGWPIAMAGYLVGAISLAQRLGHLDQAEADLGRLENLAPLVPFVGPYAILVRAGLDLEHGLLAEAEKGCQQMDAILELFEVPGLALWTLWMRGGSNCRQGVSMRHAGSSKRPNR